VYEYLICKNSNLFESKQIFSGFNIFSSAGDIGAAHTLSNDINPYYVGAKHPKQLHIPANQQF
jgi:hypothetical protein